MVNVTGFSCDEVIAICYSNCGDIFLGDNVATLVDDGTAVCEVRCNPSVCLILVEDIAVGSKQ